MKFLIDRCAGRKLANWLTDNGHDVVHVAEFGRDPGDRDLLELSASEGRILVTIDTDFGELVFVHSLPHCGIVRLPDVQPLKRIDIMRHLLTHHWNDLETMTIVTVKGGRIRISRAPKELR